MDNEVSSRYETYLLRIGSEVVLMFVSFLLSASFIFPLVALAGDYPLNIRETLAGSENWETIVYSSLKLPISDNWVVLTTKQSKKWHVSSEAGVATLLDEVTQLTPAIDQTTGQPTWGTSHVNLLQPIQTSHFYLEGLFEKEQGFTFRILNGNRIEAVNLTGDTHVIFLPSFSSPADLIPVKSQDLNIWTAPLGQAKQALAATIGLSKPDVGYLHHDLTRTIIVVADVSFPERHLEALQASLLDWNKALGVDLFKLKNVRTPIDVADCLSSRKLCIDWKGSAEIPWTGISGSTIHSFDPVSGLILGGVVTFTNGAEESTLNNSPAEVDRQFLLGDIDSNWVARIFLRKSEFASYRHPLPEIAIQSILEHEIGHYNGFAHNFLGSLSGTVDKPSATIMDYFPFPGIKNLKIGRFDQEVINAVYKGATPTNEFQACSDFERSGYKTIQKVAKCNAFDFGEPVNWYSTLANLSANGVFGKLEGDPNDFLYYLGAFLSKDGGATEEEQKRVTEFLCSKADAIIAIKTELLQQWAVNLSCQ